MQPSFDRGLHLAHWTGLVVGLTLVGCSGGNGGSSTPPTATATTAPTQAATATAMIASAGRGLNGAMTAAEVVDSKITVTFTLTDNQGRAVRPNLAATQD